MMFLDRNIHTSFDRMLRYRKGHQSMQIIDDFLAGLKS